MGIFSSLRSFFSEGRGHFERSASHQQFERDFMTDVREYAVGYFGMAAEDMAIKRAQKDMAIKAWRRAQMAEDPRQADERSLNHFERKVFSQDGTDGILHEILRRIGEGDRYFVEFGAGTGVENNSAFLLLQGWQGLWIEGDEALVDQIAEAYAGPIAEKRLTVRREFITAENIAQLFADASVPKEPAVISIDIDGNDYWVWKALDDYRPRVFILEYNSAFPPDVAWVMDYNPEHTWAEDIYQGASLRSLSELGRKKGYSLVACSLAGINSYFVRDDLLTDEFIRSDDPADFYHESNFFMTMESAGHPRSASAAAQKPRT